MVRSLRAKEMGPCTRMQFKAGPRPRRQACSRVDLLLKGNGAVRAGGARVIHRARPTGILVLNEMPATAGWWPTKRSRRQLDRPTLQSLFSFPHPGARFFHSMPVVLSQRWRSYRAVDRGEEEFCDETIYLGIIALQLC